MVKKITQYKVKIHRKTKVIDIIFLHTTSVYCPNIQILNLINKIYNPEEKIVASGAIVFSPFS